MAIADQIRILQASQGKPKKLALATVDLAYPALSDRERAALKDTLEAAAIPHWFDESILAALLKITPDESLARMDRMRALMAVEQFPARSTKAMNVHEAARLALRKQLAEVAPERFRSLSARAAGCFTDNLSSAGRIEWIFHLLVSEPEYGANKLLKTLNRDWKSSIPTEDYYALATALKELEDTKLVQGQARLWVLLLIAWAHISRYDTAKLPEMVDLHALAIFEKVLGQDTPEVVTCLNKLAERYHTQVKADIYYYARKRDHALVKAGIHYYARKRDHIQVRYAEVRYAEAKPLYQRVLAIAEKAFGSDNPVVIARLSNLALLHRDEGHYTESEPLYQRALAIAEKAFGSDNPGVVTCLNNLAELYHIQGRYAETEPLYQRALAIAEKAFGSDDPVVVTCLNNLAELYHTQGRYAETEPLYQRALAIAGKAGSDDPEVVTYLNNLVELYHTQDRYAEAELYQRALTIAEKAGPHDPEVVTCLNKVAERYRAKNRYAEAELSMRQIMENLLRFSLHTGHEHPQMKTALENYMHLLAAMGRDKDEQQAEVVSLIESVKRKFGL